MGVLIQLFQCALQHTCTLYQAYTYKMLPWQSRQMSWINTAWCSNPKWPFPMFDPVWWSTLTWTSARTSRQGLEWCWWSCACICRVQLVFELQKAGAAWAKRLHPPLAKCKTSKLHHVPTSQLAGRTVNNSCTLGSLKQVHHEILTCTFPSTHDLCNKAHQDVMSSSFQEHKQGHTAIYTPSQCTVGWRRTLH